MFSIFRLVYECNHTFEFSDLSMRVLATKIRLKSLPEGPSLSNNFLAFCASALQRQCFPALCTDYWHPLLPDAMFRSPYFIGNYRFVLCHDCFVLKQYRKRDSINFIIDLFFGLRSFIRKITHNAS